ncbi:MAG: prepilin-type N-terminal cleavage/methylation domain-containing protein [Planctomycetota bacterium]
MRAARNGRRNQAFTLVEILIVVVILGILAAIVVPQFTSAADEAREGNVVSQQRTLENQLELYRARNNGSYPDSFDTFWDVLIDDGYIKTAPKNPFFDGDQTSISAGTDTAWTWAADADTGVFSLTYFDPNAEEEEEEEEE